jgi:S-adenosylmethionine decarboxylase
MKNSNIEYAGLHLIIELWNAVNLDSEEVIENAFNEAIKACDVNLLSMKFHKFSNYGGISGVAIIEESHITIHTWPEYKYAAIDIFLCANKDPYRAIPVFKKVFKPENIQTIEMKRGILNEK